MQLNQGRKKVRTNRDSHTVYNQIIDQCKKCMEKAQRKGHKFLLKENYVLDPISHSMRIIIPRAVSNKSCVVTW